MRSEGDLMRAVTWKDEMHYLTEAEVRGLRRRLQSKPRVKRAIDRSPLVQCWWNVYGQSCHLRKADYCPHCLGINGPP